MSKGLTPRQKEISNLILKGMSDKEIAWELGISQHGATRTIRRTLDNLGYPTRLRFLAARIEELENRT